MAQLGQVVCYKLGTADADAINQGRSDYRTLTSAPHGNPARAGDLCPAMIVRIYERVVNLQVFLDGNDSYWATSREEGSKESQWMANFPGEG